MKIKGPIITFIIFLFAFGAYSDDFQGDNTILALPFANATGDQNLNGLKNGVLDLLTAFLTPYSPGIRFVDRENLQAVYTEQGLNFQGFINQESTFQAGRLMQAKYILQGSIQGSKDRLLVNVQLYDTQTTQLIKTLSARGSSKSLSSLCQNLAGEMGAFLKLPVKKIVNLPADEDPQKSAVMIQALGYYYQGQYPWAITGFIKILKNTPADENAVYWLAKSYQESGMKEHAAIEFENFLKSFPNSNKTEEVNHLLLKLKNDEERKNPLGSNFSKDNISNKQLIK